jgi:hypothetical protein
MPALPPVAGALKFEFLWNQGGLPAANVFHWGYTGDPPSSDTLVTIATNAANSFWIEELRADYSTVTTFIGVRVTDLSSDTGAVGEYDVSTAGLDGADALPAQCCVLLNFAITRRYRGGHPRMYLPPASRTWQGEINTWNAELLPVISTAWTSLTSELNGTTIDSTDLTTQVCVSYRDGDAPRVDPLVEPVTGFVVSGMIRTQRRRLTASSY